MPRKFNMPSNTLWRVPETVHQRKQRHEKQMCAAHRGPGKAQRESKKPKGARALDTCGLILTSLEVQSNELHRVLFTQGKGLYIHFKIWSLTLSKERLWTISLLQGKIIDPPGNHTILSFITEQKPYSIIFGSSLSFRALIKNASYQPLYFGTPRRIFGLWAVHWLHVQNQNTLKQISKIVRFFPINPSAYSFHR